MHHSHTQRYLLPLADSSVGQNEHSSMADAPIARRCCRRALVALLKVGERRGRRASNCAPDSAPEGGDGDARIPPLYIGRLEREIFGAELQVREHRERGGRVLRLVSVSHGN